MWTRYHLKCDNCNNVTNLRVQIPEKEVLPIRFSCGYCSSEIRANIIVDLEHIKYSIEVEKGCLIKDMEFNDGDYYLEYSDTLSVGKPSKTPHDQIMPTLRMDSKDFMIAKIKKDLRIDMEDYDWDLFKDLTRSYSKNEQDAYEMILNKIIDNKTIPNLNTEIGYHKSFIDVRNMFLNSWIDYEEIEDYKKWLHKKIFTKKFFLKTDINQYLFIYTNDYIEEMQYYICDLIIRFIDMRKYLIYSYGTNSVGDNYVSEQDFISIKNFYSDCFEFVGRYSHLVFRLQNIYERGSQNIMPNGVPKDVVSADIFMSIDNGRKLDIINLCSEVIPKRVFCSFFDNKLRNGINHYKTIYEEATQIIKYYPITRNPGQEFTLSYMELLGLSLKAFTAVLKIHELIKFVKIYEFKMAIK
jgi:hypothetical protein